MRYIIIGGSAAAISAVETIRSIDRDSRIDLFSDEPTPLFSRVLLPYYIAEETLKAPFKFQVGRFLRTEQNHSSSWCENRANLSRFQNR